MRGNGCAAPWTQADLREAAGLPAKVLTPRAQHHPPKVDPCDAHLADLKRAFPNGIPKATETEVKFV